MGDIRENNIRVFEDTLYRINQDDSLKENTFISIKGQKLIKENDVVSYNAKKYNAPCKIYVTTNRTMEAAADYYGNKIAVLNFASATTPGGGVRKGSSAQEESICRCTTLYPCLNTEPMWQAFYSPHRKSGNPLYNDDCIYTPDVYVFKSDTNFPELLPCDDWWSVNILTCAAPNLRDRPSNAMNPFAGNTAAKITPAELKQLLNSRIRRIFELAVANGNEVLILGAFGCGAFRNPPKIVAEVFYDVMQEYLCYFDVIEYAVYHTEREAANYEAFKNRLGYSQR